MRTRRTGPTGAARVLRTDLTDAERRLWYHLRDRRLAGHKFRRQFPIDRYVVDFLCVERKLVIELDGGQHAENTVEDEFRTASLNRHGYRVLRFWNDEALRDTESVLKSIMEALGGAPGPSP